LQGPRFSYEEYMRTLKIQLNIRSSSDVATGGQGMSDFQMYIIRERESYLKNLSDHNNTSAMYNLQEEPMSNKASFIGGGVGGVHHNIPYSL
jgi:hypothetical protein